MVKPVCLSVEFIKRNCFGSIMENTVACVCGVKIDIAGAIPRKDGTKVWCKVCGTVTLHHRN